MITRKNTSLAEQVFERLENDILTEKYARGEVLTELKLVSDLGVSRTPVREAIHRLEQEHLVETTLKGILVIGISPKDLADIFTIRLQIEGIAAAEAAIHMSDEQKNALREAVELQEFYVSKQNADHIKAMDNQFHSLIYQYCGSRILCDTLMPLHTKVQKFRKVSVQENTRALESVAEHKAVYEAIAAGDVPRAQSLMTEHVQKAMRSILGKA